MGTNDRTDVMGGTVSAPRPVPSPVAGRNYVLTSTAATVLVLLAWRLELGWALHVWVLPAATGLLIAVDGWWLRRTRRITLRALVSGVALSPLALLFLEILFVIALMVYEALGGRIAM